MLLKLKFKIKTEKIYVKKIILTKIVSCFYIILYKLCDKINKWQ